MEKESTVNYFDLGENPNPPTIRLLVVIACVALAVMLCIAVILAILKGNLFSLETLSQILFAIISLMLAWVERKERIYPAGQYFIRITNQDIEFCGIGQKTPQHLNFDRIRRVERRWAVIQIKVDDKPWYNINIMYKKRAKLIFQQLQSALSQHGGFTHEQNKSVAS